MAVSRTLWLVVALGACGGLRREATPYAFRQGLLDDAGDPVGRPTAKRAPRQTKAGAPASSWRLDARRRALALVGNKLAGTSALLSAVLQREVSAPCGGPDRRPPLPADLVCFEHGGAPGTPPLGVVVDRSGPRVRFVYWLDGYGRVGYLHLDQPNRRRLAGSERIANSFIRPRRRGDPANGRYLAGQLLAGFAKPAP